MNSLKEILVFLNPTHTRICKNIEPCPCLEVVETDTAVTGASHHQLLLDVEAGHAGPLLGHLQPLPGQDGLLHLLLVESRPVEDDHLPGLLHPAGDEAAEYFLFKFQISNCFLPTLGSRPWREVSGSR